MKKNHLNPSGRQPCQNCSYLLRAACRLFLLHGMNLRLTLASGLVHGRLLVLDTAVHTTNKTTVLCRA